MATKVSAVKLHNNVVSMVREMFSIHPHVRVDPYVFGDKHLKCVVVRPSETDLFCDFVLYLVKIRYQGSRSYVQISMASAVNDHRVFDDELPITLHTVDADLMRGIVNKALRYARSPQHQDVRTIVSLPVCMLAKNKSIAIVKDEQSS